MTDFGGGMERKNIEEMKKLEGFDIVIVCCSSALQAGYWQTRLEQGKGSTISAASRVVAVDEDWPGGAGNGKFVCVSDHVRAAPPDSDSSLFPDSSGYAVCV